MPQIVSDAGLPVAVTLSGLQLNISGIVGPALGGLLIPLIGTNFVFVANAACFLIVMLAILGVEASNDSITASVGALLRIVRHGDPPRPLCTRFADCFGAKCLFALFISSCARFTPDAPIALGVGAHQSDRRLRLARQ